VFQIVPDGTHIDFVGRMRLCAALSIGFLVVSAIAIPIRGFRLGVDFAGGSEMQVAFPEQAEADPGHIRSVLSSCGIGEADVVRYGDGSKEFMLRFGQLPPEAFDAALATGSCPLRPEDVASLKEQKAELDAGGTGDTTGVVVKLLSLALANEVGPHEVERVEFVGPKVGADLRSDGLKALGISFLLILIYVGFRFSPRFAPGAVVALVHDVSITAGCFVILGYEFDLRVLAALLAIVGYSLNDTIIIYDRIRENLELRTKQNLEDVVNRSINETLGRTVLTSGTTTLAVLALLLFGGDVLRPFSIAMLIGIFVGTYSTVFIAAPMLIWIEQRFAPATPAAAARKARA
jgi:preprotein translocase subunit SecF